MKHLTKKQYHSPHIRIVALRQAGIIMQSRESLSVQGPNTVSSPQNVEEEVGW